LRLTREKLYVRRSECQASSVCDCCSGSRASEETRI